MSTTPFHIALRLRAAGVKEIPGTKMNFLIAAMNWLSHGAGNEDDPWCGSMVNFCHWVLGFQCAQNPSGARSWLNAGLTIDPVKAEPGDVVVLWRESREGWKGHVGFFHGWGPSRSTVILLGGNQSDGVTVASFARERILGVRRPVREMNLETLYTGGAVAPTSTKEH
jgi:uncharacterized protein (TIGR02594 family)